MRVNRGFDPNPGGRRSETDSTDRMNDVDCGKCGNVVPSGKAHLVLHYAYAGKHQLFCPKCCPCRRKPKSVRSFGADAG